MINRELIRIKLVQILYSYQQRFNHNADAAEKELLLSLDKAYDLYNYQLLLMVEVGRMALRTLEMRQQRSNRLGEDKTWSRKFVDNRFMLQLESNKQLQTYCEEQALSWADHEEFVRALYAKIEESDYYQKYMQSETSSYEEDREMWRLIYRHFICNNEVLYDLLEEENLYWNDDKTIIDTFVLKTINRFTPESDSTQPLMPQYRSKSDLDYATRLLHRAMEAKDYFLGLVGANTRKWELGRVALMDRIILQAGLAEITTFPDIPLSVSINEYVEIAKAYSTPKSGKYINGTLDTIAKKMLEDGTLQKNDKPMAEEP